MEKEQQYNLRWVIHCAIGEFLGIGIAGLTAYVILQVIGEPTTFSERMLLLISMISAGVIEGLLLGYFQWRVLKTKIKTITARAWIKQTSIAAAFGWTLGMMPSLFIFNNHSTEIHSSEFSFSLLDSPLTILLISLIMGLLLGSLVGLFQWVELKKHVKKSRNWIYLNAIGWAIAMVWIFQFAGIPDENSSFFFTISMGALGGIFSGLSMGVITGTFFKNLQPF